MKNDRSNWICLQIGAREHYAIPRVLHREDKLKRLYTDFWATASWRVIGSLTGKKSLSTRFHPDLTGASVTGFNLQALKASRNRFSNSYEGFLKIGEAFGTSVVRDLDSRLSTLDFLPIFFGYDTGFLEPALWIKERGGRTIVCQMDPARYEFDLVREEEKRWPGWSKRLLALSEAYFQRRREEWNVADLIMVNSEWSRQALIRQGVRDDKIAVIPLAYESRVEEEGADVGSFSSGFSKEQPLRVLFLGKVILRKGIQYLISTARLLEKEPIRFDVVGGVGISDEAVRSAPSNMTFHGPVNRDRTEEFYRKADLFVLPTLSDGFALTQLEAMAHGLPVIATPNCGEVVTDEVDGLIVPSADSNALAEALQLLIQEPEKLRRMSVATRDKVEQFSLARLGENLATLENRLLAGQQP